MRLYSCHRWSQLAMVSLQHILRSNAFWRAGSTVKAHHFVTGCCRHWSSPRSLGASLLSTCLASCAVEDSSTQHTRYEEATWYWDNPHLHFHFACNYLVPHLIYITTYINVSVIISTDVCTGACRYGAGIHIISGIAPSSRRR